MIRIISSRKLRFYSPDRKKSIVSEGKNIIQDLPDWVAQDGMFKLAKSSGVISILSSRKGEKIAENNPEKVVPQSAHEEAPKSLEEFPANDQNEEAEHLDEEAAKKAAKKAARAARKAKREE